MVAQKPLVFDDQETAILLAMYDVPNGTYTSYSLAWKLNPTVQKGTPPAGVAFAETRNATEKLIASALVSGERFTGADGVYFNKLKLTAKGQRAAIQQRELIEKHKSVKAVSEYLQGKPEAEIDAPNQVAEFLGIEKHKEKK
jgi:hypothetical protein